MKFFEKVEQCGKWPQHAYRTKFFLIPRNVTSERLAALLPNRDGKRSIVFGWGAADGRNGGAERTVSETLLKMARFDHRTGEIEQGTITLVLDLVEAFERVSLPVVWAGATFFNFPQKILRVLSAEFEHQQRVQFEGPWVEVELHAPSRCGSRCLERSREGVSAY